ncbi:MAG: hypothetical protein K0U36_06175 [Alphaproteobacteria bacterium]|nr:hypothetical protein [Alphaproteobacteria bacterium]
MTIACGLVLRIASTLIVGGGNTSVPRWWGQATRQCHDGGGKQHANATMVGAGNTPVPRWGGQATRLCHDGEAGTLILKVAKGRKAFWKGQDACARNRMARRCDRSTSVLQGHSTRLSPQQQL